MLASYVIGSMKTSELTSVNVVSAELDYRDFLGAVMVRWGIRRDRYRVNPGLYAVGTPDKSSDVFVTANYKLSFDNLRKNLQGIDGWILVLDTKGVNVWCAAGKGTFGTKELVNRIRSVSLENVITHKRIILPQLGATGVAAHKVKSETGFNVHYGPVRASDIKMFIDAGYRADKSMRRITFGFSDRLKLIPNDMIYGKYYLLGALAVFVLLSLVSGEGLTLGNLTDDGIRAAINVILAYISGIVITPVLLPYIPARHFSIKGFIMGSLTFILLFLLKFTGDNVFETISWFLIITAISSFLAMNFTGSSTYTSLSGVKKEMKFSLPVQIGLAAGSIILQIIGKLI
jgi:hypothetical protein